MTNIQKERNKLWIKALRSGKFEQGFDHLADGELRCCLGVAQDIAYENGCECVTAVQRDDQGEGIASESVSDWYGWNPRYVGDPKLSGENASQWNDTEGKTFSEIAELIEQEFNL